MDKIKEIFSYVIDYYVRAEACTFVVFEMSKEGKYK